MVKSHQNENTEMKQIINLGLILFTTAVHLLIMLIFNHHSILLKNCYLILMLLINISNLTKIHILLEHLPHLITEV